MKADDGHIDESKSKLYNSSKREPSFKAGTMCDNTCVADGGYVCMYHKAEFQYECRRPWESWANWETDSYAYPESGIVSMKLSLFPLIFKFLF